MVEELTINAPSEGKVLVHFNGKCHPSNGDLIVLAASDHPGWVTNDGNVSVQDNSACFSHSRVYDVTPGSHTFYAVAHNYVYENGTGYASIYANLTVEFFPNTSVFINNNIEGSSLLIYPNPAHQELNISTEGHTIDEVMIYTLKGQQVLRDRPVDGTIDISHLQSGMYIVEVTVENTRIRQKLLIE